MHEEPIVTDLHPVPTRRSFLKTTGVATLALASPPLVEETAGQTAALPSEHVSLTINGRRYDLDLDPRTTLLDVLREHLDLTGSKKGCDQAQCGACTVLINGRRVVSCVERSQIKIQTTAGTTGHPHTEDIEDETKSPLFKNHRRRNRRPGARCRFRDRAGNERPGHNHPY